jgi:hypothetical protein
MILKVYVKKIALQNMYDARTLYCRFMSSHKTTPPVLARSLQVSKIPKNEISAN